MKFKVKKEMWAIGIIAVIVLIVLSQNLSFISTGTITSLSVDTINNKVIATMSAYSQGGPGSAQAILAYISQAEHPDFTSDRFVELQAWKKSETVTYLLNELLSDANTFYKYTENTVISCYNDNDCIDKYSWGYIQDDVAGQFNNFNTVCKSGSDNINNLAIKIGYTNWLQATDYQFICYERRPHFIVGEFDRLTPTVNPYIEVITNVYSADTGGPDGATLLYHSSADLTPGNNMATLYAENNVVLGTATYTGSMIYNQIPPGGAPIVSLREPATQTYNVKDASVKNAYINTQNQLNSDLGGSSYKGSNFYVGDFYTEAIKNRINTYNTNVFGYQSSSQYPPQGIYQYVQTEGLSNPNNRSVYISTNLLIPSITFNFVADKLGIYQPTANPDTVSCNALNLAPATSSPATITVHNAGADGGIKWWFTCDSPHIVTPDTTGTVNVNSGQSKTFSVSVYSPATASSTQCTVQVAPITDIEDKISNTCNAVNGDQCTLIPQPNFCVDTGTCTSYCCLQASVCSALGKVPDYVACSCVNGNNNTPPPNITCSDGTQVGSCSTVTNGKRCGMASGASSLFDDSTCLTCTPPQIKQGNVCVDPSDDDYTLIIGGIVALIILAYVAYKEKWF